MAVDPSGDGFPAPVSGPARHRSRALVTLAVVAFVLAAVAIVVRGSQPSPQATVDSLVAGLEAGELTGVAFDVPDAAERHAVAAGDLGLGPPVVTGAVGPVDGGAAVATLDLRRALPDGSEWTYRTTVGVELVEDAWRIVWSPSLVHPDLGAGERLRAVRVAADRGDVLAEDGTPIVSDREVIDVGVQPDRTDDVGGLVRQLEDALDVDAAALEARIEEAAPDAFVHVITLRVEDYEQVKAQIHGLPGTVFGRRTLPLAPTREFASHLLGRVGPVTAEMLEDAPDVYRRGQVVGLSGLQRRYESTLAGVEGLRIEVVAGDGSTRTLREVAPTAGTPVTVTLDPDVQLAADWAIAGIEHPAALVAQRVSDGHVLAVANNAAAGFDLAMDGQVPPGSVFKILTSDALLAAGVTADATVACPNATVVDGRRIQNAENFGLGDVDFRTAFANSCNTTMIELSGELLGADTLRDTAARWGLGAEVDIGTSWFPGAVPTTDGPVDLAETSIGQGRTLVSPLAMVGVASSVARGRWVAPSLVIGPNSGREPASGDQLPNASTLADLMRTTAESGSGRAVAGAAGGPVAIKTGTAEYGTDNPPRTHAWTVGFQGDIAFSVLVAETDGAFGGDLAVPIARDFLDRIAGRGP